MKDAGVKIAIGVAVTVASMVLYHQFIAPMFEKKDRS